MRRLAWAATAVLAACTEPSGPGPLVKPEPELNFVRQDAAAPKLDATTVSFYAYVDSATGVDLAYKDGDEFLEFDVPAGSLYPKPDGSPFAAGDSVLITITVVDAELFQFEFQPAGLRFHPSVPAQLEIEYVKADHDFDDDGEVGDDDDAAIATQIGLWYQEKPGDPWTKLVTGVEIEADEIEADIFGFSRFAVAW